MSYARSAVVGLLVATYAAANVELVAAQPTNTESALEDMVNFVKKTGRPLASTGQKTLSCSNFDSNHDDERSLIKILDTSIFYVTAVYCAGNNDVPPALILSFAADSGNNLFVANAFYDGGIIGTLDEADQFRRTSVFDNEKIDVTERALDFQTEELGPKELYSSLANIAEMLLPPI